MSLGCLYNILGGFMIVTQNKFNLFEASWFKITHPNMRKFLGTVIENISINNSFVIEVCESYSVQSYS